MKSDDNRSMEIGEDGMHLQERLTGSDEKYWILVENSFDIIYSLNQYGEFTFLSNAWTELLGHGIGDAIGRSFKPYVHPEDVHMLQEFFDEMKATGKRSGVTDYRLIHKDGTWHWFTTNAAPVWDREGKLLGYTGTARDITTRKKLSNDLYLEKEYFRATLLSVGDAVISTDSQGNVSLMNHVAQILTGWTYEEALGKPLENILDVKEERSGRQVGNLAKSVMEIGEVLRPDNMILTSRKSRNFYIEVSPAPIRSRDGAITGAVIVFNDITEKRTREKEIEFLSFNDHLTGLYNRRYFDDSIRRLDTDRNLPFSVLVVDINGLKLINDSFGHEKGDCLIRTVGKVLKNNCRAEDIVARTGGDEFAILLPKTSEKDADLIANRINESMKEEWVDQGIIISTSIGSGTKNNEDESIFDALRDADMKMYKIKAQTGKEMRLKTVELILGIVVKKYFYEDKHLKTVSKLAKRLAAEMKLGQREIREAELAGRFHDIGKISAPAEILNKAGELDPNEAEMVRRHPVTGYQILKNVDEYSHIAEAVLYHHERYDGKGYPSGLRGGDIPLISRIINVVDAYEAMTSTRSYKEKMSHEEALMELRRCSGKQFDSRIVNVFIEKVANRLEGGFNG